MSRDEEDKSLISNSMEPDHSTPKPAQLPPEVQEELLRSMTKLETLMELEKEGLRSLKDLLFHEQFPSLKSTVSFMESALELIESLLGEEEECLSEKRIRLLSQVGDLARTFYHSSITTYLRMGSVASSVFAEEFNRAYWKGVSLKGIILEDLRTMIDELKPFVESAEKLRLYRGMLELTFNPNITTSVRQLALNAQVKDTKEKEGKIGQVFDLVQDFIKIIDELIILLRALEGTSIDPLIECISAEHKGIEKILDVIQRLSDTKVRKLKETEIAQTCDVISWGLDDKMSVDDLLASGREYMAEISKRKDWLNTILNEIFEFFHTKYL